MQEMKSISDRWYSTKKICAYLGVSRDTLLVWSNEKDMPTSKSEVVGNLNLTKLMNELKVVKLLIIAHTNLRRTDHEC